MFYTFRQNNSGGVFAGPVYVCVEADTLEEANSRGEDSGFIYFDGVTDDRDCSCCGDRWTRAYFVDDFTESPTYCGKPLTDVAYGDYAIIYRNGTIKRT